MKNIDLDYQNFKSRVITKGLPWNSDTYEAYYNIYAQDGGILYNTYVYMPGFEPVGFDVTQNTIDRNDFETNYKIISNTATAIVTGGSIYQATSSSASPGLVAAKATATDVIYTIPESTTLTILKFTFGACFQQGSNKNATEGSACDLLYDPNGNGNSMLWLFTLYSNGHTASHTWSGSLNQFVGNGTKKIRMRRRNLGDSAVEMYANWEGTLV